MLSMAPYDENTDGWKEWSKHVLYQLEEAKKDNASMREEIKKLHDDMLTFKVQAGVVATIASAVMAFIMKKF